MLAHRIDHSSHDQNSGMSTRTAELMGGSFTICYRYHPSTMRNDSWHMAAPAPAAAPAAAADHAEAVIAPKVALDALPDWIPPACHTRRVDHAGSQVMGTGPRPSASAAWAGSAAPVASARGTCTTSNWMRDWYDRCMLFTELCARVVAGTKLQASNSVAHHRPQQLTDCSQDQKQPAETLQRASSRNQGHIADLSVVKQPHNWTPQHASADLSPVKASTRAGA